MKKSIFCAFMLGMATFNASAQTDDDPGPIIALEVSHGACFGKCPDHKIKISNTGLVTYTGRMFTPVIGKYQKKFNKAKMQIILKHAAEYRMDTCIDAYPYIPDLPSTDYVITYKNRTKKIRYASRGPAFLQEISDEIAAAVQIDKKTWKKTWKKISSKID